MVVLQRKRYYDDLKQRFDVFGNLAGIGRRVVTLHDLSLLVDEVLFKIPLAHARMHDGRMSASIALRELSRCARLAYLDVLAQEARDQVVRTVTLFKI